MELKVSRHHCDTKQLIIYLNSHTTNIMLKPAFLFCLIIVLFPAKLLACSCAYEGVVNNFQQSKFVAKAKIVRVTPDTANQEYHDAEIEIIKLYKGEQLSKIKIMSSLNSSCAFLPDSNTTWIIFANVWQGILSFGFCSGSMQIDMKFDSVEYPNAGKNWSNTVKLRESVIAFLSEHNIPDPNPLLIRTFNTDIASFKGYKNKNRFAIFQVDVNSDFSIKEIKQLKKFQNRKLNNLVYDSMKKNLKLRGRSEKPIAKSTRLILFCYYYEEQGSFQSFVSFFDV